MNYRSIISLLALLLLALCLCMVPPCICALLWNEGELVVSNFYRCLLTTGLFSGLLFGARYLLGRRRAKRGKAPLGGAREGFAAVSLCWFFAVLFSSLPFVFVSSFKFCDAIFESASGLTTTGASVISNSLALRNGAVLSGGLESLPRSLLLWRSLLNWLGGVGIVFFMLLVLPFMHLNLGRQLYNAEVPGIKTDSDQMTPRLITSVMWIVGIYVSLTALCALSYRICGMSTYEAICHSFATISTGGFSTRANSFGTFSNAWLHWSVIFFMFISACNFSLIIKLCTTRRLIFLKDAEWRFFFLMVVFVVAVSTALLRMRHPDEQHLLNGDPVIGFLPTLRISLFQIVSVASTTGFGTSDYESWGISGILLLLGIVMFPCGCGGSTAGGIKCSRVIVAMKYLAYEVRRCVFPRTLSDVRLNNERLGNEVVNKILAFIVLYILIFIFGTAFVSFVENCNLRTAVGASLTCLSNVGPGFGKVGPSGNFGWMLWPTKLFLSLVMVTGRLELYTVLVLFFPSFWKR